jgi:hypothetical protein
MHRITCRVAVATLALSSLCGCESAPRSRAVEMGPVNTGPASVEAVRRQLMGSWELTALEVYSPSGDKIVPQASGRLQYDDYGNLSMKGTIDGAPGVDPSVLNLTGQVAIDPTSQSFRFVKIAAASADERRVDPALAAANTRYYEFADNLLKTTVKAADGRTTATATWKRIN